MAAVAPGHLARPFPAVDAGLSFGMALPAMFSYEYLRGGVGNSTAMPLPR